MMKSLRGFLFAIAVLPIAMGCSNSSSGGIAPVGTGALSFLSPGSASTTVNSATITIEVLDTGLARVAATVGGVTFEGVLSGSSFFIFAVALAPGVNDIEFDATDMAGDPLTDALSITSTAEPSGHLPPAIVSLDASPTTLDAAPFEITLTIDARVQDTIAEVLIDNDGDAVFDTVAMFSGAVTVTYPGQGVFKPRVVVRTTGNLLFSSDADGGPLVTVVPPPAADPALNITSAGTDLADLVLSSSADILFALSAGDGAVRTYLVEDGSLQQTIALPGVANPRGIAVDEDDNLYVADTGNNRVLKLLEGSGYLPDLAISPDGTFGTLGSGPGELNAPMDVAVAKDANGDLKIFVADTGNNRVQRFNLVGVFEQNLSTDPGAPGMLSPSGIIAFHGGGLLVSDTGNNVVRVLTSDGELIRDLGAPGSEPGQFSAPTHLSQSAKGLLVADTGNSRLQRMRLDGALLRVLEIAGQAAVDVQTPEEPRVLVAPPSGDTILVVPVPADPPGFGPIDAVQEFVAALAASDFSTALSLVFPSVREETEIALQDPTTAASVALDAAAVSAFEPVDIGEFIALVTGERATPTGPEYNDFVLERDPVSGRWLLTSF